MDILASLELEIAYQESQQKRFKSIPCPTRESASKNQEYAPKNQEYATSAANNKKNCC